MRGCRRGTLSGMDAAPEPTWTYLRRVPHRHACKRPQQTEAFAQSRQTSCARLFCVGTSARARSNPTPLQESWDTKTRTASRSHCQPSGLHRPANERCYATAAVLPATTPRSR
ncbi:hypothetical protein XarbCFBP8138_19035 [Xanthomonas arboricola]|nr:hypothetical protein XarbCFBP8138_19035 [Xanthomonas arboricola]